jgi:hypothetical protein
MARNAINVFGHEAHQLSVEIAFSDLLYRSFKFTATLVAMDTVLAFTTCNLSIVSIRIILQVCS